MKLSSLLIAAFSLVALSVRADQFEFQSSRVETLILTTTKQGAHLVSKVYDRVTNKSSGWFKLELKKTSDNVYATSKGATFTLKHLTSTHNEGQSIDSGDWELRVTGSGPDFEAMRERANEDGDSTEKEAVFYGSKK